MAFFDFMKIFSARDPKNDPKITPRRKKFIEKDALEERLIESDMDFDLIEKIFHNLPEKISPQELEVALHTLFRGESFYDFLQPPEIFSHPKTHLIIGVNGAGKTTTIAKLAQKFIRQKKRVLLVAGDTFRAAAVEQLTLWAQKIGAQILKSDYGADPAAVAFDGVKKAREENFDVCIIDTAGRLENQENLKNQLSKIAKTVSRAQNDEDFLKILVLDGTQGSGAVHQAKIFHELLGVSGVIITKMDGTSKGGALLSIYHELKIPIIALGMGESADDLRDFDVEFFIKSLVDFCFQDLGENFGEKK